MVNTGKPSAGCHTCRVRRIKCDETRPACLKCQKTNRLCPGYREDKALEFKDMTAKTMRKFEISGPPNQNHFFGGLSSSSVGRVAGHAMGYYDEANNEEDSDPASPNRLASRHGKGATGKVARSPSVPFSLATPVQQQAMCYFISAFGSLRDSTPNPMKSYGFLGRVVDDYPDSTCLQASLAAVSLAALSTRRNCRRLRLRAIQHYIVAVRSVNAVIQTKKGFQRNDTTAAVLALAFYETLMSPDLSGYYHHLHGAAMIARLRGKKMCRDPLGAEFVRFMTFELAKIKLMQASSSLNHDDAVWEDWIRKPFMNKNPLSVQNRASEAAKGGKRAGSDAAKYAEALKQQAAAADRVTPSKLEETPIGNSDSSPGSAPEGNSSSVSKASAESGDIVKRYLKGAHEVLGSNTVFNAINTDKVKFFVDHSQQLLSAYVNPTSVPDREINGISIYERKEQPPPPPPPAGHSPHATPVFNPLPPSGPVYIFHNPGYLTELLGSGAGTLTMCHLLSRCTARIHPNGQHVNSHEYQIATQAAHRAIESLVGAMPWIIGWRPPPPSSSSSQVPSPSLSSPPRQKSSASSASLSSSSQARDDSTTGTSGRGSSSSNTSSPSSQYSGPQNWEEPESQQDSATSAMFLFLWPAFAAASSEFTMPKQREYMLSVLRHMGQDRGIYQAMALLRIAEGGVDDKTMMAHFAKASDALGDIMGLSL